MPRRKKRAAWGTLTQVDSQTWRIRYWSTGPDGYKRRSKTVRGSRLDAERARSELMLTHSDDAPCPTVGEVWERWALPAWERRVESGELAPRTVYKYKRDWNRHIAPRWADVPCDAVKPLHVQQWLDGMAYSAAWSSMVVLRPLMDYAVRYGVAPSNPFREKYLMPSKGTVERHDKGTWSLAELGEIWRTCAHGTWWEASFLLCAFGGLRVGESLGVRSERVSAFDVDGQTVCVVRVEEQMPYRGDEPTSRLKTPQSRRTVAIPGRAGARLLALSSACDGYLSGDGMGSANTQRRLAVSWEDAMGAVADGMRHPYRNLRNSYETNMRWEMKLPPWIVEPMLGHKGTDTTGMFYDRPTHEMYAQSVAEAYAAKRYDKGWDWAS